MLRWFHEILDDAMLPLLKVISPGYKRRMPQYRTCDPCALGSLCDLPVPGEVTLKDLAPWRGYRVQRFGFANAVGYCETDDDRVTGSLITATPDGPWVLIIPGYSTGAIPRSGYSLFQTLQGRLLVERGVNVALMDLPLHMLRKRPGHQSGEGYFSPDLARTKANVLQSAADAIAAVRWLGVRSGRPAGLWGTSLGGCVAGLAAAQVGDLGAVVLMEPLDNPGDPLAVLAGAAEIRDECGRHGVAPADIPRLLADVSPSAYPPAVPRERLLFITPEWDRVVPPRFQEAFWEAWGRPERIRFAAGHIGLVKDRAPALCAVEFLVRHLAPAQVH